MLFQDDLGREEGYEVGPQAGKGAVLFTCSGEDDFDGLPGDELPPRKAPAGEQIPQLIVDAYEVAASKPMI
jgi:hypothetical protein